MTRTRWFALACLILAMALWGSSYVVLKVAFRELPPLWVIFGRMALGSLVFLVAWRWRGRIDYRSGDWKYLLGLAVCEPCLYFLCESFALQYTSAAQAGMITALLPLLVAVGAWLLLHERIGRMTWIGFGLAVLGSIWLSLAGELVVTVGAYGLYNFGVGRLPASQASGFINLIPVFTLVFAALFLGETLNGPQMLAAGLVFIGVAISQWRSAPPPPPAGVLN